MSKEMTPLEALETIKEITSSREQGFNTKLKNDIYYQNELDIIEKALKENERLKTSYLENLLNEESKEYIYKKLKALEIIKKYIRIENYESDYAELIPYPIIDKQYVSLRSWLVMSKEEYELLKEVLSND